MPMLELAREALSNGDLDEGQCYSVHSTFLYADVQSPDYDPGRGVLTIHVGTGAQHLGTDRFHIEGDLGKVMAMVEKADVGWA